MPYSNILLRLFLYLLLFSPAKLFAQCPVAVSAAACTGTEPLVTADEILNKGTTRWYYGPAVTMNSLTLRGGKLIVCGDLTIDKFYMDSGQVIINPGGRFVIGSGIGAGMILMGNSSIYNYGILEIQRNLSLENGWATSATPNILVNATSASVLKMPNQYFVINNSNSWFVNNGVAQFWGLITDGQSAAGSVCLGPESHVSMNILINKVANTYTVPSGGACVYVVQLSQFFGALTTSHNLFVCLAAGHHSDTGCVPFGCIPNAWGAAQVINNCNTCASLGVLPLQFLSFDIQTSQQSNFLEWRTDLNAVMYMFYIERSDDGKNFYTIDSVQGNYIASFHYKNTARTGISYYRIRGVDIINGKTIISKIVSSGREGQRLTVYPSPFTDILFIELPEATQVQKIVLHDINGINIPIKYIRSGHRWLVRPLTYLPKQILLLQVITNDGVRAERIIKE